jgi:hypothetical protein
MQAKQTWPSLDPAGETARSQEIMLEASLLQEVLSGTVPANVINISEQLLTSIRNLSDLILTQITYRENPNTAKANLISDADLKKSLDLLTELQYASGLSEAELQAELTALHKLRNSKPVILSETENQDLKQILGLRSSTLDSELNANLAIASLKDEPFEEGVGLTAYGTDGDAGFSAVQRLWAQFAVESSVRFLGSRLSQIKLASKLLYSSSIGK